eukprot:CAMPEP_0198119776 /NCGR_PEP_ID=MMETSP1442-20131203/26942_1 /TAXON_ID= /ORGANISM="Craspedostauros australis, Strain CCMP3328" /LENGTH=405 /DNA_ID=CAMNT_0043778311 /DNA_START=63 /DNA_END=1280 /DNA_ORIENTATION=+
MKLIASSLLLLSAALGTAHAEIGADGVCRAKCTGDECVFNVKVDLLAGELGYYIFDECGGEPNPTIGLEYGKVYKFVQSDRSNWYHPLGFAYFADGAHDEKDELEPRVAAPTATDKSCALEAESTCPAPMYFKDGNYVGEYSNIPSVANVTMGKDNFGLDDYEPLFFHPPSDWTSYGDFEIKLMYPETAGFDGDIFYFCHIHQFMTGRIKFLKNDVLVAKDKNEPVIPYEYDVVSDYDKDCGTFNLDAFQLPHPECPDRFVCDVPGDNSALKQFSSCIDSMNCHMMAGMTTGVTAGSAQALFMHQMIPHHQNAVNMAKALLNTNELKCDDLENPMETDDCTLEIILREIINTQNAQIQSMRGILDSKKYPEEDDCKVEIGSGGSSLLVVSGSGLLAVWAVLFALL